MAEIIERLSQKLERRKTIAGTVSTPRIQLQDPALMDRAKTVRKVSRHASLRQAYTSSSPEPEEEPLLPIRPTPSSNEGSEITVVFNPVVPTEIRRSFDSFLSAETIIHVKPRELTSAEKEVSEYGTYFYQDKPIPSTEELIAARSQYEGKPLPTPPEKYVSRVSQFQTPQDDDWESAVDESYQLGEFAELGSKWLEKEERGEMFRPLQPPVSGSLLSRGRSVPSRPFRDEYDVSRPRPAKK